MTKPPAMPELPEPDYWSTRDDDTPLYTADQMRAYAIAALQSAQPAEVSDEQKALAEQLKNIANGIRICGVSDRRFVGERLDKIASTILALRPQAVPMTEDKLVACLVKANCVGVVKMSYDSGPYCVMRPSINASKLKEAIEAHHGIAQRADAAHQPAKEQ